VCYSVLRHAPYPLTYPPQSNRLPPTVDSLAPPRLISTVVLLSYIRHRSHDDSGSNARSSGKDTGTGLFSVPAASILSSIHNFVILTATGTGNSLQRSSQPQGHDRSDPTLLFFSRLTLPAVMDQVAIHTTSSRRTDSHDLKWSVPANNTVLYGFLTGVWNIVQILPILRSRLPGSPTHNSPLPLDARLQLQVNSRHGRTPVRWTPADEASIHQHIKGAIRHFPNFSVNRNVGVGFLLMDILRGRDNLNTSEATFGGIATTHIRIKVSHSYIIC